MRFLAQTAISNTRKVIREDICTGAYKMNGFKCGMHLFRFSATLVVLHVHDDIYPDADKTATLVRPPSYSTYYCPRTLPCLVSCPRIP